MTSSVLLPRLDPRDATRLQERLLTESPDTLFDPALVEEMLAAPRAFPSSGGIRATTQQVMDLRSSCLTAQAGLAPGTDFGTEFDLSVGRELGRIPGVAPGELGVARVWDFLTLVVLPDIVAKRLAGESTTVPLKGSTLSRITGGDRRHVLQRLWKRWTVLGDDLVEGRGLTDDDYAALLERRLTLERRVVARQVAHTVISSGFNGTDRRAYTRTFMRYLVQTSGIVHLDQEAPEHLSAVLNHLHNQTVQALEARRAGTA